MKDDQAPQPPAPTDLVPVPIRVRAGVKARWVRESRAEGMKLGEWIERRVDRPGPTPRDENDAG